MVFNYGGELSAAVHAAFYRQCRVVLSPSRRADISLVALGIETDRIVRWAPGVDLKQFNPGRYDPAALGSGTRTHEPGSVTVLYAGALGCEQGTDLLAEAISPQSEGYCPILHEDVTFGLGFKPTVPRRPFGPNAGSFGHFGTGGALGFADPVGGVAFGYVMNHVIPRWQSTRNRSLIDALYGSL